MSQQQPQQQESHNQTANPLNAVSTHQTTPNPIAASSAPNQLNNIAAVGGVPTAGGGGATMMMSATPGTAAAVAAAGSHLPAGAAMGSVPMNATAQIAQSQPPVGAAVGGAKEEYEEIREQASVNLWIFLNLLCFACVFFCLEMIDCVRAVVCFEMFGCLLIIIPFFTDALLGAL